MVEDLWIEGLTAESVDGSAVRAAAGFGLSAWPAASALRINRCVLSGRYGVANINWSGANVSAPYSVRIEKSRFSGALVEGWFATNSQPGGRMELLACRAESSASWYQGLAPADLLLDVATVDTPGYGPAYGEWYAPQFQGASFGFGNTLLLADGQHDRAQILLYRVLDDGAPDSPAELERYAWMTTRPDPVTGYWEFRYLPTTRADGSPQRYAYTIWTPEGYGPQTHGRYLPAPAP
jgi:hypothetical protein